MKLIATVVILGLVCHLALGQNTTTSKFCGDTQYWNGTGCASCPTGCAVCIFKDNAPSCLSCIRTDQYLQITNDVGTCANCSVNCTQCRGPAAADCIKPADGQSVNPITKTLVACSKSNCQYCNVDGTCGLCNYKYRLDNGTCAQCTQAGCARCNASVSNCSRCFNGYQLNGTTCSKCSTGCESCNGSACTVCAPGYVLGNGVCTQRTCPLNCANCDSKGACTTCNSGYFLNATGNTSCDKCSNMCDKCTSATQCTACLTTSDDSNYRYVLNGTSCSKCNDQNCEVCDTTGACTKCFTGYLLNSTKGCTACSLGCETCSSNTTCTKCRANYRLTSYGNVTNCTSFSACSKGQQMDSNGNCSAGTIENCKYGDATNKTCLECAAGYFADGSKCSPCQAGCFKCEKNATGYLKCLNTYVVQGFVTFPNDTKKADSTGYLCPKDCAACDLKRNCTACMPNYIFTQSIFYQNTEFCMPYDVCPHPEDTSSPIQCYTSWKNHTKNSNSSDHSSSASGPNKTFGANLAMSFIVTIVASLYIL